MGDQWQMRGRRQGYTTLYRDSLEIAEYNPSQDQQQANASAYSQGED
jgi:hypothetical protein